MKTIFVVLSFFLSSIKGQQLPPLESFTCRVKIYENTMHKGDFLYSWKKVSNIKDCIGYCAQYKGASPCKAVNYFTNIGGCDLLSKHSWNPNAEPAPSNVVWMNVRYAEVLGCDAPTPSPPPVQPGDCGRQYYQPKFDTTKASRNRIVNGNDANPHSWPWVVSITYYGKHFCGGSLIPIQPGLDETDMVVTAAHCLKGAVIGTLDVTNVHVVAGSHLRTSADTGEQTVQAESLHWHDLFSNQGLMNDIALIKLKGTIKFSNTIKPICLPDLREATALDSKCFTAGWGRQDGTDKSQAEKLQQLQAPIIDSATCKNSQVWGGAVNAATMLCAGTLDGKQNVCGGDSGGPLMCWNGNRWVQHGVVSFVHRKDCTAQKKPGVYTRVSMYKSWIDDTIRQRSGLSKAKKWRF